MEKNIKEDMDVDVAKEEEEEVKEEIVTTFIILKGVINQSKVVEEEEVEEILVEQMKGGMINLMLNVVIAINMAIFLRSVEPMLKKRQILLMTKKKIIIIRAYGILTMEYPMCGYKEKFVELEEKVRENVSFGDSSKVQIQGKGTILISLKDGSHKFIKDVYYAYEILMKEKWLKDQKSNLVAKVLMSRNRMFMLSIKTNEAKCLKASIKDEVWCWHMRFGHLNFGALKALGDEKMVKGMPHINHPNQLCEACLLGKHARRSFPKEAKSRANEPLQLMHTDICGPIDLPSFSKNKYFLLFINDFNRKTWVYFLKHKSEAFVIFKNFKALVEKESGYNDIHHRLTIPRSPQQNEVVERKNRTILNMARYMLKVKSMPKEFWAEVVSCAVYLSNHYPTRNIKGQTPQEAWSGVKPKVGHFRVFGRIVYAHVPNQGRSKLDDRSVKHVFIGYYANSKGYKLYNPNNGKIINLMKKKHKIGRKKKPVMISFHILKKVIKKFEPLTFDEAMDDKRWRQAMEEEIKAIKTNDT
ncbi:hypothetical protein CR513_06137, partial [Mucuna pruriens]